MEDLMRPVITPRRPTTWWAILAALLVLSPGARTQGAPITFEFGGVINDAGPSAGAAVGDRFSGSLTYDPDQAADSGPGFPWTRQYALGQSSDLTIRVGEQTVYSSQGGLLVLGLS